MRIGNLPQVDPNAPNAPRREHLQDGSPGESAWCLSRRFQEGGGQGRISRIPFGGDAFWVDPPVLWASTGNDEDATTFFGGELKHVAPVFVRVISGYSLKSEEAEQKKRATESGLPKTSIARLENRKSAT